MKAIKFREHHMKRLAKSDRELAIAVDWLDQADEREVHTVNEAIHALMEENGNAATWLSRKLAVLALVGLHQTMETLRAREAVEP